MHRILLITALLICSLSAKTKKTAEPLPKASPADRAVEMVNTIMKYHYMPRAIDRSFAEDASEAFLDMADPYRMIFTCADYERFAQMDDSLAEEILNGKSHYFDAVSAQYRLRLQQTDSVLSALRLLPLDFSQKDTITIRSEMSCSSEEQRIAAWRKRMKFEILGSLSSMDSTAREEALRHTDSLRNAYIDHKKCQTAEQIESASQQEFMVSYYLKSLAKSFDPHTDYRSAEEELLHEHDLSSEAGSFGLEMTMNDVGEIEVAEIVPLGPAALSKAFSKGDIILSIESPDTSLDPRCIAAQKFYTFLERITTEKTHFTIRKKNGAVKTVSLQKAVLDVKENSVVRYLLGDKSVGYMALPSFFGDYDFWNFRNTGSANELAKALVQFRQDSISGLILDLRGNGGGVMLEALQIAGLLIDKGTLCAVSERNYPLKFQKDSYPGLVYKDPLVVLVDRNSASASELLAAVLQDCCRAVIVGSPTFGKAVMQRTIPADASKFDSLELYQGNPSALVSTTVGGLYRISGESWQKTGVIPDIIVPNLADSVKSGEKSYPAALSLPKEKASPFTFPAPALPISQLKSSSKKRLSQSRAAAFTAAGSRELGSMQDSLRLSLDLPGGTAFFKHFELLADSLDQISDTLTVFGFEETLPDTPEKEREDDLKRDLAVREGYMIIKDILQLTQSKEGAAQ